MMAIPAHVVGWPFHVADPKSPHQALFGYQKLAGTVKTSSRVDNLDSLSDRDLILCDVTPRQLLHIGRNRFSRAYARQLQAYRYGPGAFKVDYALSAPIPWKAPECARAATVHVGGSFDEIFVSEKAASEGRHAERPFIILAQPSLFDETRAPAGKHTAWAYCHVPNGSTVDMLARIEAQIERFAPGFSDCVLASGIRSATWANGLLSS
jgi:phytoene dehydrogenase-like protein